MLQGINRLENDCILGNVYIVRLGEMAESDLRSFSYFLRRPLNFPIRISRGGNQSSFDREQWEMATLPWTCRRYLVNLLQFARNPCVICTLDMVS